MDIATRFTLKNDFQSHLVTITGAGDASKMKSEKGGRDEPSIFQQDSTCMDSIVYHTAWCHVDDGVFRHASPGAR
jgi:hypothetical protein